MEADNTIEMQLEEGLSLIQKNKYLRSRRSCRVRDFT